MGKDKYWGGYDKGRKAAKSDSKDIFSAVNRVIGGYPEKPSNSQGSKGFFDGYKGKKK
jgi:hypothetical protein